MLLPCRALRSLIYVAGTCNVRARVLVVVMRHDSRASAGHTRTRSGETISKKAIDGFHRRRLAPSRGARYIAMEMCVFQRYQMRRAARHRVSASMMRRWGKSYLRPHQPQLAAAFKGSSSWVRRFCSRHGISFRRVSNSKAYSFAERLPACIDYLRSFRGFLMSRPPCAPSTVWNEVNGGGSVPRNYGSIAPHLRLNLDQVR